MTEELMNFFFRVTGRQIKALVDSSLSTTPGMKGGQTASSHREGPKHVSMHVSLAMQGWSLLKNKLQCKDMEKEVKENIDECCIWLGMGKVFPCRNHKGRKG